jgi:hypothetical protein
MAQLDDVDAVLIDVGGVLVLPADERVQGALDRIDVATEGLDFHRAHYAGIVALGDGPVGHHADGLTIWHAYNRAYASVCGAPDERLDEATAVLLEEFGKGDIWRQPIPGAPAALDLHEHVQLCVANDEDACVRVESDVRLYAFFAA